MGVASLSDHAKYKKHKGKEHNFNNSKSCVIIIFSRSSSSSTLSSSCQSSQVQSAVAKNTINSMILPIILNAEIKWSMKVVQSQFSLRSCIDLNKLLYMFPDSEIAQKFQLGKTKLKLVKNIVVSPFYTVSFDESMNRVLQNEEMDVQVRYWDVNTSITLTHSFF